MSTPPRRGIRPRIDKALDKGLGKILNTSEIFIVPGSFIGKKRVERMMEIVVPLGIQPITTQFLRANQPCVVQITLGNDIDPAIKPLGLRMHRTSQFLQKMECGKVENPVNRIEAQSIYAKFRHPIERIFNKEPPDFVAVRPIKIDG